MPVHETSHFRSTRHGCWRHSGWTVLGTWRGRRCPERARRRELTDRAAHSQPSLLLLRRYVLPEPVQVVLGVRDLERQQEERDQVQQEARDVADPVVEADELLRLADPLVVAPLRDERRNDQEPSDRVRNDREEDVDPQRVLLTPERLAEVVEL